MAFPAIAGASCTDLRRLRIRAAILTSAILICALATTRAQDLPTSDDQNTVRGTVVNAVTHAPIPRALVHSADDHFAEMTDSDGHFEFSARPGLSLWLLARKPGFLGDRNTGRALEASPGREITIPLTPESIIQGKVTTSTGETLPRIEVQLLSQQVTDGFARWTPSAATQTRSDGSFRFAELPAGPYKVMTHEFMDNDPALLLAPSYGFPPVYFPASPDFAGAATIDLAAGQTADANLTISDQSYYPVKIPVASGEMNGGMEVRVTLHGRPGPGYSLGYNPTSHKIEGLLPNGNYTVQALTYGADSASGEVNLRVAGAPAEGPALTLTRNSSLTLNVQEVFTHADSQPGTVAVSLARRMRDPPGYLYPQLEPADDFAPGGVGNVHPQNNSKDNSLILDNVLPGRYFLRLNTGYGYVASATMGGLDLLHQPFEVSSGSNIPIEITVRDDTATLQGTVANSASASGSSQAWVYCVPIAGGPGQFQEVVAGADGKFNFAPLAPGTYRVMAFANPQLSLPYRDAEAMRAYDAKGQLIQLSAGQNASLQLQEIPDE